MSRGDAGELPDPLVAILSFLEKIPLAPMGVLAPVKSSNFCYLGAHAKI